MAHKSRNKKNKRHKKRHETDKPTNHKQLHHHRKGKYEHHYKENRHQTKLSTFINNYRQTQQSNGYITVYQDHKKSCRGISWEASEIIPDFLWLGSLKSAHNTGKMYDLGISYVLNCADRNFIKYNPQMFNYLCLNAKDKDGYNILSLHLNDAIEFIEQARLNNRKIFINCVGGVNRSATIVIGYLLYLQPKPSLIDAITCVLDKRPFALTNKSFQYQLLEYEHCLCKQKKKEEKIERKGKKKNKKNYNYYQDNEMDGNEQKNE